MNLLQSRPFALFLNLLVPGLGHVLWREYLFGVFILMIALIAAVLFVVTYFIDLSNWTRLILLTLPVIFYVFTFFDLDKTVRSRRKRFLPDRTTAIILLALGAAYQAFAPTAAGNFMYYNAPAFYSVNTGELAPVLSRGDVAIVDRLDYRVEIPLFDRPIFHSFPDRFDLVRFDNGPRRHTGMVVGRPTETVEISGGVVVVNGAPVYTQGEEGMLLQGAWPLTSTGNYSILVATFDLGVIDSVRQVPLQQVIGKVSRLL